MSHPRVKEIKSVSSDGLSEVKVEFEIAASPNRATLNQLFTQLRAKIRDSQNRLPPGAGPSMVYDDSGDVFALYYAITGEGYTLPEIVEYAKSLQKELVLVPGVAKVSLLGAPQEVIYIEYSRARLVQMALPEGLLAQVLEGQNLITPAGSVVADRVRMAVRPDGLLNSVQAIGELVITESGGSTIRLKDIASVRRGLQEPAQKLLFKDGRPAIGFGISNIIGGNVVNMGDAVATRLAELENLRPIGIELEPISNQGISVRDSVSNFVMNVVLALVIVVGTLLVFMGLRSGLLMGGILLITVAGTLFGMYLYGLDMQRISLGALIIALGMLVDNAIVVVEGTLVRVQGGENPKTAAIGVVEQTKWPLLGGTIVGFLAFSPIGFSPDNTGEYAGSLFWTITISLLFSWLVAIWLTPFFCTLIFKAKSSQSDAAPRENLLYRAYRGFLGFAIRIRWLTIAIVIVLFVSGVIGFVSVKQGFFPASTRAQFVVDYTLPEGTDIDQTTADLAELSAWIRKLDTVTGTSAVVGGGHLRFMLTYNSESAKSSYGQVLVDVGDYTEIAPLLTTIQTHINETYPDSLAKVWRFVLGPGGGSLIEARFSGSDPVVLRELNEQAKAIMANAGAISVKDDWGEKVMTVRPRLNEANAQRAGLTQGDISKAIAAAFDGSTIGVYREGDKLLPIIFRPYASDRDSIDRIRDVQVFSSSLQRYVPITQVVDTFDVVFEDARQQRFDRALSITAQSDPMPDVNANDLFTQIQPKIEAIALPPGYTMTWKGQYGNSQEANAGLAQTMPFGFGAMIIVVILLFNAVRQPVIIWLTVPLALIGVVYGLIATGTPFEFIGILAMLSLTGMLIKNAIVLIDQIDVDIASGKPRMTAIIDSSVSRLRPVFLGSFTTILGVIPLLWDPFFRSLAVVIISGLSFATVLTLIVVPTLYAVFFNVSRREYTANT